MLAQLNNRWTKIALLIAILLCFTAESADARCRRRFRRGRIGAGAAAAGEAAGEAMGNALLMMLGIVTLNPDLMDGEVSEPVPPKPELPPEPAEAPEPWIDPCWTQAWKVVTLVGEGVNGDADATELTLDGIGLAIEILNDRPATPEP